MKRSALLPILAFLMGISNASSASACMYIPWLDPFAWLGFYGCGYGYGGGCGYGQQMYQPSYNYAPAPMMNYQVAPVAPGCNCTSAAPVMQQVVQQQLQAVQVPVTTYRAVTQYVPQTSYQTQYRSVPVATYQQSTLAYQPVQTAMAAPVYNAPVMTAGVYPTQTYAAPGYQAYSSVAQVYAAPTVPQMQYQPQVYQAPNVAVQGDIYGDHEYVPQSASLPVIPNSYSGSVPARQISYGVTPRAARTFSGTVK
ncbi:MAG: hypothetical protein R3C49_05355 [Planctomycetaceae bacterium]